LNDNTTEQDSTGAIDNMNHGIASQINIHKYDPVVMTVDARRTRKKRIFTKGSMGAGLGTHLK